MTSTIDHIDDSQLNKYKLPMPMDKNVYRTDEPRIRYRVALL